MEPEDSEGAWYHRAAIAAVAGGRGHSVIEHSGSFTAFAITRPTRPAIDSLNVREFSLIR